MKTLIRITVLCIVCTLLLLTVKSCKSPDFSPKETEEKQVQKPLTRSGELVWDYPIKPGTEK